MKIFQSIFFLGSDILHVFLRYDFDNSRHPSKRRLDPGTPHMAEMFKKQGYITGIVGKHQPIYDKFEADNLSQQKWLQIMEKTSNYNKALGGGTGDRIVF